MGCFNYFVLANSIGFNSCMSFYVCELVFNTTTKAHYPTQILDFLFYLFEMMFLQTIQTSRHDRILIKNTNNYFFQDR
jgi:hypothetical protein